MFCIFEDDTLKVKVYETGKRLGKILIELPGGKKKLFFNRTLAAMYLAAMGFIL